MVQPQEDTSHPPNVILNQALDSDTELDNNHRTASPSRATTLQEGRVLKSGYLMKKGERLKIWKKRWFVLRTSKLAYYKDNKEYELLRIVDFRDLHRAAEVSAKHKENVFVILTPRRTFTVQAKNHADMQDWIDAINEVKAQFEFTSSSDLESFAGSTLQLGLQQQQQSSNASGSIPGAVTVNRLSKPTLRKLGSGMALPRRHRYTGSNGSSTHVNRVTMGDVVNHVGISMAGATNATPELHTNSTRPKDKSKATKNTALAGYKKKKKNIPAPLFLPPPPSKQFQETTEILNTPTTSPRRCSSVFMASLQQAHRTEDSSPLPTSSNTTQQLSNAQADDGATLPSPAVSTTVVSVSASETKNAPRKAHTTAITTTSVSGSPSSPGNHSGGEETFWATTDHNNLSSGEDEIHEEDENNPCFLEAGRVASEANAPGSGVISAEELGNKVVRQGYLLKLGNKYKTWRKKWFVLRGDNLTYYKNTKEYQPHGIIPLSTVIDCLQTDPVSKSKLYCLRIVTTNRSFLCSAPDEDTLLQWLDTLHVECERVAKAAERERLRELHRPSVPISTSQPPVPSPATGVDASSSLSSPPKTLQPTTDPSTIKTTRTLSRSRLSEHPTLCTSSDTSNNTPVSTSSATALAMSAVTTGRYAAGTDLSDIPFPPIVSFQLTRSSAITTPQPMASLASANTTAIRTN